jgi:2-polyprenyl-3-methyl-5-hydroxy-6-metoxy-1,4-benzoquinol methylase
MMVGYDEKFHYMECSKCGCLQLIDTPSDLGKYYSDDYYSFEQNDESQPDNKKTFSDIMSKLSIHYYKKSIIGHIASKIIREIMPPIKPCENAYNKKILDVGCGNGALLRKLQASGFKNLYGVDLFIKEGIESENIKITKGTLNDMHETFDIIMLNHSLEHIQEQTETLQKVRKLLNETGTCIIRIPTVSSYAWRKYRENWFALDAPRHIYLHSLKSIRLLCEKCDLKVHDIEYDSLIDIGLERSKLYAKGLNLKQQDELLYSPRGLLSIFKHIIVAKFLNFRKQGDSIIVRCAPTSS